MNFTYIEMWACVCSESNQQKYTFVESVQCTMHTVQDTCEHMSG